MYIAKGIIIPIIFAVIIAIVLHPVVNFLVRLKINRVLSILITMLLTFLVLAAFGSILISQVSKFGESWPILVQKFGCSCIQTIGLVCFIRSCSLLFHPDDRQSLHRSIYCCLKNKNQCIIFCHSSSRRECVMGHSGYVSFYAVTCHY